MKKLEWNNSKISGMFGCSKQSKTLCCPPVQVGNLSKGLLFTSIEQHGVSFNFLLIDAVTISNNETYLKIKISRNDTLKTIIIIIDS